MNLDIAKKQWQAFKEMHLKVDNGMYNLEFDSNTEDMLETLTDMELLIPILKRNLR